MMEKKTVEDHAVFKAAKALYAAGDFTSMRVCVEGADDWLDCGIHPGYGNSTLVWSWAHKEGSDMKTHVELAFNAWTDRESARALASILWAWADTNDIHDNSHIELPQTQEARETSHD